jgi:hypothetical protein
MARQRLDAAEWAVLIDEWRRGGLSLPAFCKQRGLSRGTMQNWVYKPALRRAVEDARRAPQAGRSAPVATAERPTPPPAFLPVRLAEVTAPTPGPTGRSAIEVVLGGGRRIVVGPGFDPETLRLVVAALEA